MYQKRAIATLLVALSSGLSFAQHAPHYCAAAKQQHHAAAARRGTVADPLEDSYDVKYVKLDVALNNQSATISGNAITHAVTTAAISEYVFELTSDLTIDSVRMNGLARTVSHNGDVGRVALAAPMPAGTAFEAQVFYHGSVPGGSGFFDRGIRTVYSGAAGRNYTFTLGESYLVKDWWPCKQALKDKIDSSDVWITVPDTLMAGSNGLLQQVTTMDATHKRYEWKSRNPIDYYLISASVGAYTDYSYYMHFSNSTDSMLMQNYIYPNALALRKPVLDSTALMIDYFSTLFGRYPFWREKYGHCQAPLSGGEEHQTMTTIGIWDSEVVPHELSHQWFGDHVTCGTWQDIWLNEGFASYAEYLFVQHFKGAAAASGKIGQVHYDAMRDPYVTTADATGAVYVDDTTSEDRIFSSRLSYNKASSVIHTLRFEANNDSLFFATLRDYQQQYANSTATTEQFKTLVAQHYGRNMDTFFNQWIYSSGWPVFNAAWNQKNGIVLIRLDQQTTGNYTAHKYSTPLEIRFSSQAGDTTIRVYTNDNATTFSFAWSQPVTSVTIDPNDWLLDEPGAVTRDNSLGIAQASGSSMTLYPNPAHDYITISGTGGDQLQVADLAGRTLINASLNAGAGRTVDVRSLMPGMYLYRLLDKGSVILQGKIVRE